MQTVERVLLVAGAQNTGKSNQLRSMFLHPMLGGQVPTTKKIPEAYPLANGRWLYVRLTSPHEWGETLTEFIDKIRRQGDGTWCVASAMQVEADNKMPDIVDVVIGIRAALSPTLIRVCLLSPDWQGNMLASARPVTDGLWRTPTCEVLAIDARDRRRNGLLLGDTFDYT